MRTACVLAIAFPAATAPLAPDGRTLAMVVNDAGTFRPQQPIRFPQQTVLD